MIRLGVTGTDTGVGKTVVAVALTAALRRRGLRVAAMKPLETGVAPDDPRRDAAQLHAAAGQRHDRALVGPVVLPDPLAPWVAAERVGRPVDLAELDAAFAQLAKDAEAVVVEGAGGLLVPITPDLAYDGLFRRWRLDLVVVAANRLGALNHTLLTVRAARAAGLRVRAVVLNDLPAAADEPARRTNLAALRALLPEVPIVPFPTLADPPDPDAAAHAAETVGLVAAVAAAPPDGTAAGP